MIHLIASNARRLAHWSAAFAIALLTPSALAAQVPVQLLHSFSAGPRDYLDDPLTVRPVSALIQASNGNFYGTTQYGGTSHRGTVFTVTPAGLATILHSFTGADGALPSAGLIQANDGNLYGTTQYGGASNRGVVFRMSPAGAVTVLYAFQGGTDGANPRAAVVQGADGNLYGTTVSGGGTTGSSSLDRQGTAFRLTLTGSLTALHTFNNSFGQPSTPLIQAADGNFYGTVFKTFCNFDLVNCGGVFRMAPDGSFTVIRGAFGEFARPSGVIQGRDGNLYGVTMSIGSGLGTVYSMTMSGATRFQHAFTGPPTSGAHPEPGLIEGADGFYGTTRDGGLANLGTIFRVDAAGTITGLYSFVGSNDDGAHPASTLLRGVDGNFYGATFQDEGPGFVIIFRMTPDGTVSPFSRFTPGGTTDGGVPTTGLLRASDGNFYATTAFGAAHNNGAVLKITPSGVTTVVHAFTSAEAGGGYYPALIEASDGNFYGTSRGSFNNTLDRGTVFRLTPAGTFTTLHRFTGPDGANPDAPLVPAADGHLYGTTHTGGALGEGTVFRLATDGGFTLLHSFTGGAGGGHPITALIQAADGYLYGTTEIGGVGCCGGTAFRVSTGGTLTVIHSFTSSEGRPEHGAALIQAQDGYLYGTTDSISNEKFGAIFRMDTGGALTILHEFSGSILTSAGIGPYAGLIQAADGTFYGTTQGPLSSSSRPGSGTVFKMTPAGAVTFLHTFSGSDGESPSAPVVLGSDGNLYGTTGYGGVYGRGVVFRLNPRFPLAPTVVSVAPVSGAGVKLQWSAVPWATSYNVKRSTAPGAEVLLASVTSTSFLDTSATQGQHYYYIVTAVNEFGESGGSPEISITAGRAIVADFDGDGRSNISIFRPSTGTWYLRDPSTGLSTTVLWGGAGDIPTPGDYDGDGRIDIAVFRPSNGTWYIRPSQSGVLSSVLWGGEGDVPLPGDYDGDGADDLAVFRRSTSKSVWYVRPSSTGGLISVPWAANDVPVPGDYNGDGTTDMAVYGRSTGYWFFANGDQIRWGGANDVPVPGDYDGDGMSDVAVFRPSTGTWYIRNRSTGVATLFVWGGILSGTPDVPVPADYDGDGKTDIAVFRPSNGTWYIRGAASGVVWGSASDIPLLRRQ